MQPVWGRGQHPPVVSLCTRTTPRLSLGLCLPFLNPALFSHPYLQPNEPHFLFFKHSKSIPTSKRLSSECFCLELSRLTLPHHSKNTCFFLGRGSVFGLLSKACTDRPSFVSNCLDPYHSSHLSYLHVVIDGFFLEDKLWKEETIFALLC